MVKMNLSVHNNILQSRIMLNHLERCCKISLHPQFRNFNTFLHGKEWAPLVVQGSKRYRSYNNKRARFVRMAEELRENQRLKAENKLSNEISESLKKMKPPGPKISESRRRMILTSLQEYIIETEAYITADSLLPISVTPLMVVKELHKIPCTFMKVEGKWSQIFRKTENPRVKRLLALIAANDKTPLTSDLFSMAMGQCFYMKPPVNSEVPSLTEFKPEEIKLALQRNFGLDLHLNFLLEIISNVLMKAQ